MVGLPWIQTIGASTGMIVALASPTAVDKPFNCLATNIERRNRREHDGPLPGQSTKVLELYDRMLQIHDSPIVRLNRAVAVSYVDGPGPALAELAQLDAQLDSYVYFHSARAELLRRLDRVGEAGQAYERALACEPALAEHTFLERQLEAIREQS